MASKGDQDKDTERNEERDSAARARNVEAARSAFALKMAALHDLSLDLSLAQDVDDLCRRAVTIGHGVLGFDRIGIWFIDPDDPALLFGSYGTDESGDIRDERDFRYRRSAEALPQGFYEGREPVYYLGVGPCFNHRHEEVGSGERALALIWDGRTVMGEIWVDNLLSKRAIDGGSLELLVRFARIVGYLSSFKRAQSELKHLSEPDEAEVVVNKNTALVVLEKQLSLAARKREHIAVIICRMNGFRDVNELHGRSAADDYAATASALLAEAVRDCDTVGRYGNDRFLIVLPSCDAPGAATIDARIDSAAGEANGAAAGKAYRLSLTRGIACADELGDVGSKWTSRTLVDLAEKRMLAAKL
jgi:diguanylate cyclase (GGDEF)-like protein